MRVLLTQKMGGVAGSETYYLNLLPALVQRGIEASFLIIELPRHRKMNDDFARRLETGGVEVIRLSYRRPISWTLIRDLASIVRAGGYDLVQSNLPHADVWMALTKRLFVPGMRLVSTKHSYSSTYQLRHGFDPRFIRTDRYAIATRLNASQADRIVTISHQLGELLTRSGLVDARKLEVIPYGFTFDVEYRMQPGEARFGSPQIISVARLVEVKQHHLLIRAFARLAYKYPDARLVLVGDGPEEASLKRLAKTLGIPDRIVWTGRVSNPHDYLRDSDIFVLTSAAEGFGAVILEAWHNRLPVITFDVPAPNEIISHEHDGILVKPFDQQQLQHRMEQLITDPELRRSIGQNGRKTYESRFSIEMMTSRTIALYRDVIDRSSDSGFQSHRAA